MELRHRSRWRLKTGFTSIFQIFNLRTKSQSGSCLDIRFKCDRPRPGTLVCILTVPMFCHYCLYDQHRSVQNDARSRVFVQLYLTKGKTITADRNEESRKSSQRPLTSDSLTESEPSSWLEMSRSDLKGFPQPHTHWEA